MVEGSGKIKMMENKVEKNRKILEIYKKYYSRIKSLQSKLFNIKSIIRKKLDQKRIEEIRKKLGLN